jgi:putative thioredoxin
MIDITITNFETDVIAASNTTPVLVDFWAEWCGPCKALGPVLEKLEREYAGRFILAKIDSDAEQQLAQAFGVRSIPTVILLKGGRPVDGFVGALPEGQIKQFLDKHLDPAEADPGAADEAAEMIESGDLGAAIARLEEALAADPDNIEIRYELLKLLLAEGRDGEARAMLDQVAAKARGPLADKRFAAIELYLQAIEAQPTLPEPEALTAAVAANKRDFPARYALAQHFMCAGDFQAALDELLEIIMRDKAWNDELARRSFVAILELLTRAEPKAGADPKQTKDAKDAIITTGPSAKASTQDPMIAEYRRKLSMALF